jgi:hypothetical protein
MGLNGLAPALSSLRENRIRVCDKNMGKQLCSGHSSIDLPKFTREAPNFNSQCSHFSIGHGQTQDFFSAKRSFVQRDRSIDAFHNDVGLQWCETLLVSDRRS